MTLMQFKTLNFTQIYPLRSIDETRITSSTKSNLYTYGMFKGYWHDGRYSECIARIFGIDSMVYGATDGYDWQYSEFYDGAFFYKKVLYYLNDMKPNSKSFDEDKTTRYKTYSMDEYGVPVNLTGLGTTDWFITKTAGNPYFGFIPTAASGGSNTTYYCEDAEFDLTYNNNNGNGNHWFVWRNGQYASPNTSNTVWGFFGQDVIPLNASYEALGEYGNEEGLLRLCYLN